MSNLPSSPAYANPPIIEALLDIDCDFPPNFELAGAEAAARDAFSETYPQFRQKLSQEFDFTAGPGIEPNIQSREDLAALQFLRDENKQIVQLRTFGFSFNRMAPYSTLDEYLPEIERCWNLFRDVTKAVQVRAIRLRYINRIVLPAATDKVDLDEYFAFGPSVPCEDRFLLTGFVHQIQALDTETGHHITTVLTRQQAAAGTISIIFDNGVAAESTAEASDWDSLASTVEELRSLKNTVFEQTLTNKCKALFQD